MPDQTVDSSLSRKVKDVAAGFVGGATQVLIGQPADLVKVRLQTSTVPNVTSTQIVRQVLKNEGAFAFYKGTLPPLVGVGVCVSLQFYGFHEARRQILRFTGQSELGLWPQTYIAGACAGLVNTPVTAPVEQLRILSQSATTPGTKTSLSQTVRLIYQSNGVRHGIYRGFNITLLREVQAYGVWFLTYEFLISSIQGWRRYGLRDDIATAELLGAGATAGLALWLLSYPIDVVKLNIQSDKFGVESKFRGRAWPVVQDIWARQGARGFWKGLTPCLLRAVPCSAGTFASVELALRLMG